MQRNSVLTRAADDRGVAFRSIAVRPNTFDASARTFTGAVLATARPIQVRGGITEALDLGSARLPESLPLLLDHRSNVRSTVGRMSNLRIVGDELIGDGRLTADPSTDWLAARIADGTVGSLSIGYTAERTRDSGTRSRTVVPRLLHASLVSEPADDRAGIRSTSSSDEVDDDDDQWGGTSPLIDDPERDERRIRVLGRELGLRTLAAEAIAEGLTYEEFRERAAENRRGGAHVDLRTTRRGLDDPESYRRAAVDSLVVRMTGVEPQGPARELASLSWPEFHRRHLRQSGQGVAGLSDAEVVLRALSTSDLPLLAGEAFNISMRRTFDAVQSPLAALAGARTLPDFRKHTEALTDWTTLKVDKVNELGEFKSSFVDETGESYTLYTIGGITGVSRQVWFNAGGRLGSLSEQHGRRLGADVNDRRVAFLVQANGAGPTMRDNKAVFHADRGNIAPLDTTDVGSVIDSMFAIRAAMAKRKGAGDVMIGMMPRYWVVPVDFEATAIRALATINATTAGDVNPLSGRLEIVAEPRLTNADRSYLVCAPASFDGMVQAGLEGAPGPMTESRWGFEVDAVQYKIRLDIGFGWVEWRSWTRLDHEP